MLERDVEPFLREQVSKGGGRAAKWVSPGWMGVPDRLIFLPRHPVFGIEVKAPGKQPTLIQARVHETLRALGFTVFVVSSYAEVDAMLSGELPCH